MERQLSQSEVKPCGLGNDGIEAFAEKVRVAFDGTLNGFESLKRLVERFGGTVVYSDIPNSDSITVQQKHSFTITLSSDATVERQSFSLAHELGHYFLHSRQGSFPLTAYRFGTQLTEREANRFAAALLMPKDPFVKAWKDCEFTDTLRAAVLSDVFHVSMAAVENRAKSLSLSNAN